MWQKSRQFWVSLTDDPSWSTHMPFHALVTRLSRCPGPAAALACDWVTRSRQCPQQGTLTFLTVSAWGLWVTVVTCGTPGWEGNHVKEEVLVCIITCVVLNQTSQTCSCQRKLLSRVWPFTVLSLISLWTGGASVVIKSLRNTSWTKTFQYKGQKNDWYLHKKTCYFWDDSKWINRTCFLGWWGGRRRAYSHRGNLGRHRKIPERSARTDHLPYCLDSSASRNTQCCYSVIVNTLHWFLSLP